MSNIDSVLFHNKINSGGGHYIKQLELMKKFTSNDVEVIYVSPEDFDSCEGITHVSDTQLGYFWGLAYATHLLSVFYALIFRSPERFVPFTIFGGFVGAVAGLLRPNTETILFMRGDLVSGCALAGGRKYSFLKRITLAVEWFTFRYVDRIVFISEQNRKMMLERNRLRRSDVDSVVLYNDVYTDRVLEQLDRPARELAGWPVLGYAGGFPTDEGKGIRFLIEAVAELETEFPDIRLYLLGDGGNEDQLRNLAARRGVGDKVMFTGWVNDPLRYMRAFDLFVLPSLHEGLGNSLLESLAAGTPIAGSDVGGIPEVVGDVDLVFEPRSSSTIVNVVRRVFESEETYESRREQVKQRRELFDFDWATTAMKLVCETDVHGPERVPQKINPSHLGWDRATQTEQ